MTENRPLHTQRDRADSFGSVARAYDAHRPRYPDDVVDRLVDLAGGGRVLDVGAGTGIAAEQLARRGCEVLAVEPDAEMAALAADKGIDVEHATFEDWDPDGRTFDLVLFAQSWHWVFAEEAAPKAYSMVRPGGSLALLWHMTAPERPAAAEIDAVSARYVSTPVRGATGERPVAELLADTGFVVSEHSHPVRTEYTTQGWLDMVSTYSAHIVLDPEVARGLRSDLSELIGTDGVTVAGIAHLTIGTRPR